MFIYCPPKPLIELESQTATDGKRVYTLPDGIKLPSVTTVVGYFKKKEIIEWRERVGEEEANRVSRLASTKGRKVHTICEKYLNNDVSYLDGVMPDSKQAFKSIQPYLDKINNIHYQEQVLYSKSIGLAGRVDCIGEYEGVLSVIDFKTSKRHKERDDILDYFWQTTAYACMYQEMIGTPINQLVIIMTVEGSKPLIFKEKTIDHVEGLAQCIVDYKNATKRA